MTLRAAEQHYREQAALAAAVVRQVRRYWRKVPTTDVDAWRRAEPVVARLVAAAQFRAASSADEYTEAALSEQRVRVAPDARVSAAGFAGMQNGAASVLDLVDLPRIRTLEAIGAGVAPAVALAQAGRSLDTYVASLVQDAGRQAVSAAVYVRPDIGYRRMVNAPCCVDCAILAGKWFKANAGFDRHPRCDCTHIPAAEDAPGNVSTDPAALFASGQVKGYGYRGSTEAERKAIADGADPRQVINARRGVQANKMFTTEGTTTRGVAGRVLAARGGTVREANGLVTRVTRSGPELRQATVQRARLRRPTPEAIYANATSREDAIELLRLTGYIT